MTKLNNNPPKRWRHLAGVLLCGFAVSWWTCGCVHRDLNAGREAEVTLPKLTALMTGPAALLLTNLTGFESECRISLAGGTGSPRNFSGRLFAHGGKLSLEMVPDKYKSASTRAFGVIWDVASGQGYVFSEALQGYAALTGSGRFTNLLTAVAGQTESLEGHPVDHADVTAIGADGQRIVLHLTRAQDLGNLPLQIRKTDEPDAFTLMLAKVQKGLPPEELFLPPDGFTKYESETALLDELNARQHNVFENKQERGVTPMDAEEREGHHRTDSNGP